MDLLIQNQSAKSLTVYCLLKLVKILLGGVMIGVLHAYPMVIALMMAAYLMHKVRRVKSLSEVCFGLYLLGLFITGALGLTIEYYGTHFGFWHYFSLPAGTQMPIWLIFAWPLAYDVLYDIEYQLCQAIGFATLMQKLSFVLLIAFIYPTAGEIAAINTGTWVYHLPLQSWGLWGVPVIAMGLLVLLHSGVFLMMTMLARRLRLNDRVFR